MHEKPSAESILCAAIEIESLEEREAYLATACGADPEMKRQVKRLLNAHFQGGSLLDSPAKGLGPTVDQPVAERPGTRIGPYKLMEQIGEGGFGFRCRAA